MRWEWLIVAGVVLSHEVVHGELARAVEVAREHAGRLLARAVRHARLAELGLPGRRQDLLVSDWLMPGGRELLGPVSMSVTL